MKVVVEGDNLLIYGLLAPVIDTVLIDGVYIPVTEIEKPESVEIAKIEGGQTNVPEDHANGGNTTGDAGNN